LLSSSPKLLGTIPGITPANWGGILVSSQFGWNTNCANNQIEYCGRVALGGCPPRAPTDPYMHTLEHTAPRVMVSLLDV
jgi:hypothetical protein